jgi:hypothetical protein
MLHHHLVSLIEMEREWKDENKGEKIMRWPTKREKGC